MAAKTEIRPVKDLTDREKTEYARVRAQIDYGEVLGYEFSSEREWRVLVWENGHLASHVGIGRRRVAVGDQDVDVGAVGGVWTAPESAGSGRDDERRIKTSLTVVQRLLHFRAASRPRHHSSPP